MPDVDFSLAKALVFDPVRDTMMSTRQALLTLGFQAVDATTRFDDMARMVAEETIELLIAEPFAPDADVCRFVRQVRAGDTAINPFLVILFATWPRSQSQIREALGAGADDLLLRPFSTADVATRIGVLTRARKGFVVTGDYIGPDRRKDPNRESAVELFHPPNTLQAAAQGDVVALQTHERAIQEAARDMARERVRRLAMRVAASADLRRLDGEGADAFDLGELDRAARELRRRLSSDANAQARTLANALVDLTTRLLSRPPTGADFELARDLSMGAFAAYAGQDAGDASESEVDRIVADVRGRIHGAGRTEARA